MRATNAGHVSPEYSYRLSTQARTIFLSQSFHRRWTGALCAPRLRYQRCLHFVILAAEIFVIGGEARGVFGVDLRQVELVPSGVDDYFCAGQGVLRRWRAGGTSDPEYTASKWMPCACEMFAEQPRLRAAEIGKRIVMLARAGLAVADQIQHAQAICSIIRATRWVSAFTRWSKLRKRSSVVWPRQNRK